VVTESTCAHYFGAGTDSRREISGTVIREDIRRLKAPPHYMMRGDISEMLIDLAKAGKAFNRNG
jgi:ATP sulfurylase